MNVKIKRQKIPTQKKHKLKYTQIINIWDQTHIQNERILCGAICGSKRITQHLLGNAMCSQHWDAIPSMTNTGNELFNIGSGLCVLRAVGEFRYSGTHQQYV